jgi:hypothetical protein
LSIPRIGSTDPLRSDLPLHFSSTSI